MASIPLILLLATIVSAEKCTNPLPALMQIASGVDITSLDLFPIGNSSSNRGLLENVFNFTCSGVKIGQKLNYSNHSGDNFANYDLPDQITSIDVYSMIDAQHLSLYPSDSKLMNLDWTSVMATLLHRLGLNIYPYSVLPSDQVLSFGPFARSSKYTSLLKQYFVSNKAFYHINKPRSSELELDIDVIYSHYTGNGTRVKQSILSKDFLEFITHKLPPKYEDNVTAYETLIARFGTHYFAQVYISDYDHVLFALDQGYLLDTSDWQIGGDMSGAYKDYFKRWNDTSESISNTSEILFAYRNGSYRWVDKLTGTQHISKQFTGLSIRKVALRDITDLIDNKTIKAQVSIAVIMHRIKAQLETLNNIYNFTSDYYQLSSEEKVALENVTKLANSRDIKKIDQTVSKLSDLYDKVRRARDKHFLGAVIEDLYVIASTRLEFAKQICTRSFRRFMKGHWSQSPASQMQNGERETSKLYKEYHSNEFSSWYDDAFIDGYLHALTDARQLNQHYGLRADITNGLTTSCAY